MNEAHLAGDLPVAFECFGLDELFNREMAQGGLQVLTQREQITICFAEICESLQQLLCCFAQTEHDSGLGVNGISAFGFDFRQDAQRSIVSSAGTNLGRQSPNGLEVMIENLRLGSEDGIERSIAVEKIRNKHFDNNAGIRNSNGVYSAAEVCGATILQVVPSDSGNDHVRQGHAPSGFRDALRFVRFQSVRFGGRNGTEAASASAAVPGDHESCSAFAPAFPMVGAFGALANGVQLEVVEQMARLSERGAGRKTQSKPLGKTRPRGSRGCRSCIYVIGTEQSGPFNGLERSAWILSFEFFPKTRELIGVKIGKDFAIDVDDGR